MRVTSDSASPRVRAPRSTPMRRPTAGSARANPSISSNVRPLPHRVGAETGFACGRSDIPRLYRRACSPSRDQSTRATDGRSNKRASRRGRASVRSPSDRERGSDIFRKMADYASLIRRVPELRDDLACRADERSVSRRVPELRAIRDESPSEFKPGLSQRSGTNTSVPAPLSQAPCNTPSSPTL